MKNGRLILAEAGRTEYTIVIPEDASEAVEYAAVELKQFLKEISDADFPVMPEENNFSESQ